MHPSVLVTPLPLGVSELCYVLEARRVEEKGGVCLRVGKMKDDCECRKNDDCCFHYHSGIVVSKILKYHRMMQNYYLASAVLSTLPISIC